MDREAGENSFEHGRLGTLCRWGRLLCGPRNLTFKDVFTWQLCKTIAMGQALSMLICGTAVTCQYLADAGVETPMLQSFLNYTLLLLTYTLVLAFRRGENNIVQILKTKWWKYFLMALTDVEANYTVVKAYQFTTLTSIQLLDCFVIPVLMVLSWIFLKTRYRPLHFISVAVCLLGVGAMVGADLLAGRDQGSSTHVLLGDGLVLVSAALYAVSNVCQEYTVKNLSRVEFLGMMGLFGTFISGVQMAILESKAIPVIRWNWTICLLFVAYTLCMYGLYSFMPIVVKMTSATAVNLSLLTADLFSLFCGIFLFRSCGKNSVLILLSLDASQSNGVRLVSKETTPRLISGAWVSWACTTYCILQSMTKPPLSKFFMTPCSPNTGTFPKRKPGTPSFLSHKMSKAEWDKKKFDKAIGYSFAIVGINITDLAYSLLVSGALKTHLYNVAPEMPSLVHFQQTFCYLMQEFHRFWIEEDPCDIMEFNRVRTKFHKRVLKQLKNPDMALCPHFTASDLHLVNL